MGWGVATETSFVVNRLTTSNLLPAKIPRLVNKVMTKEKPLYAPVGGGSEVSSSAWITVGRTTDWLLTTWEQDQGMEWFFKQPRGGRSKISTIGKGIAFRLLHEDGGQRRQRRLGRGRTLHVLVSLPAGFPSHRLRPVLDERIFSML